MARRVATSILIVLAVVCLIAGVGAAVNFVVTEAHDPAGSVGETIIAVIMGLLVYGPMMVVTGWPFTVPVIVVVGLLVAYFRSRSPTTGAAGASARVILLGYAFLICLAWLALLLNPR